MTIDWQHFTPWAALAGGVLIGLASAAFILLHGRILGVSGILGGLLGQLLRRQSSDLGWRIAFLLGVVLAPALWLQLAPPSPIEVESGWATLIIAGLLVGIGTRYGAGCTSGHGICGLARLSPRSLVATLAFMATGFITVHLVRHTFA